LNRGLGGPGAVLVVKKKRKSLALAEMRIPLI
jgi:hypothetical protein